MNMIPFIVTLLVLSTVNVDAQNEQAFAVFNDANGTEFGALFFEPYFERDDGKGDGNYAHVNGSAYLDIVWRFPTEEMYNLGNNFQLFLHDSADCGGDFYESAAYNVPNCATNEWGCIANEQGSELGLTESERGPAVGYGGFILPGTTVKEIFSLSVGIYIDDELLFCADIQQRVRVTARADDDAALGGLDFDIEVYFGSEGVVTIEASWNSTVGLDLGQIQIRENPAVGGECSSTGDIFNPAGRDGPCAYGDLTCGNETMIEALRNRNEVKFPYMDMQTLFCNGERSVAVILEGETEPLVCYNFKFDYLNPVHCPPSPTIDEDESSAFGRGPYQSYFFAVVFCLSFYFQ